jgi:hypothetical protein
MMNDSSLSLILLFGIVVSVAIGFVLQNPGLGSPVQILTLAGVIYLIVRDVVAALAGGKRV